MDPFDNPHAKIPSSSDEAKESMVIGLGWNDVKQAKFIIEPSTSSKFFWVLLIYADNCVSCYTCLLLV